MADIGDWVGLPSVLIVEVYTYLSLEDRLAASAACRQWRACLFHPSLWSGASLDLNCSERSRTNFLANRCGRFVEEVILQFNSRSITEVRECLRILRILSQNKNLQRFSLQPSSCHIEWPENEFYIIDSYLDCIESLIQRARHLHHLALGCVEQLQDLAPSLLPILAQRHATTLTTLHLASVKEDSQNYGIIDITPADLAPFRCLHTLSLDYDYLTADVLLSLTDRDYTCLSKLLVHIHGVSPDHPHVDNTTWRQIRQASPGLEVWLTLLHSYEGVGALTSILQPSMPLVGLRQFFCSRISTAAITFIGSQLSYCLRELEIVEGMPGGNPVHYDATSREDPFVMLTWRCMHLHTLRLIGLELAASDIIAISRLRGPCLRQLDVALSCITHSVGEMDEITWIVPLANMAGKTRELCQQVKADLPPQCYRTRKALPTVHEYASRFLRVLEEIGGHCLTENSPAPYLMVMQTQRRRTWAGYSPTRILVFRPNSDQLSPHFSVVVKPFDNR